MWKHGDLALCIMETLSNFWDTVFRPGQVVCSTKPDFIAQKLW